MTTKIFLDANVLIGAGKPPGGPIVDRVADLVDVGVISILTTDLTITEVVKKHVENDYEVIKEIARAHFRRIAKEVTGTELPKITKMKIREKLTELYNKSVRAMFATLKAETLAIDSIKPSVVFSDYAAAEGFFSGDGKKDQFPDAFIFECLKNEASETTPMVIVSNDGDFDKPVSGEKHISLVKSFPELFIRLGLEVAAPELDDFFEANKQKLLKAADRELADWGLIGDVEDAEIDETAVSQVEIENYTAFKPIEKGGDYLVVGRLSIKANVSYSHPNWDEAAYDSEDKVLIPFENVSGETEVDLEVDVFLSIEADEKGDPLTISELRFRNSDFQYVELHPYDPYEYM